MSVECQVNIIIGVKQRKILNTDLNFPSGFLYNMSVYVLYQRKLSWKNAVVCFGFIHYKVKQTHTSLSGIVFAVRCGQKRTEESIKTPLFMPSPRQSADLVSLSAGSQKYTHT